MSNNYGTTWWGQRWLNALTGIDYENRIPRGLSYARSGKVYALNVDTARGLIKARVEGHYDPFYSVKIELAPFSETEKKKLIAAIIRSPVILAKLSARELAPEIETVAKAQKISIFPEKWDDLKVKCSCPDWAVPCKHIAAVIYKISQQIDANPFILFELRGLDLVAELSRHKVNFEQVELSEILSWKDILKQQDLEAIENRSLEQLKECSFAEIPNLSSSVLGLFKPSPAGYTGKELRELMGRCLLRAGKLAQKQFKDTDDRDLPVYNQSEPLLRFDSWGRVHFNASLSWVVHSKSNAGRSEKFTPFDPYAQDFSKAPFFAMFSGAVNQKLLEIAPVQIEALYQVWLIATKLVQEGAVIPQMYEPIQDFFAIRWIPAVMSEPVRKLTALVGASLLQLNDSIIYIERQPEALSARTLGEMLLSVFIGSYINAAYLSLKSSTTEGPPELQALFLSQMIDTEEYLSGESIKKSLEAWIAPLYLEELKVQPVIILEDRSSSEEFSLSDLVNQARSSGGTAEVNLAGDSFGEYVDYEAKEQDNATTAPVAEDGDEHDETTEAHLFDNQTGVQISMGFNRLDQKGSPDELFVPLSEIIDKQRYSKIRFECLRTVARLSAVCPILTDLLENHGGRGIIKLEDLASVILSSIPAMRLLGVKLIVPKSLKNILYPKSSMTIGLDKPWDDKSGYLGIADLLNFSWDLALGNQSISETSFKELCKHAGKIVRFKNSFVYVDPAITSRIAKKLLVGQSAPSKQRLMAAALTGRFGENNVMISKELKQSLEKLLSEENIAVPQTLKASLRPYQVRGYSWLTRNLRTMMGSIIADDMGLGKTLQVIAALEKLRCDGELDHKSVLVVVPTSLVVNWERELTRFAPQLKHYTFYAANRDLKAALNHAVIITTYGVLRTELKQFKKEQFRLIVIDEAQAIKNAKSLLFKAVRQIKADSMIAMSGTPVENRLSEYWSIMDFVNPGLLGSQETFSKEFAYPIERNRDPEVVKCFKRVTAPFILRRLKNDKSIISDLPDKISIDKYCTLTKEQVALYQAQVERSMELLEVADKKTRSAVILNMIAALKVICNAPEQYSKEDPHQGPTYAGKMEVLFDLLDDLFENRRKVLIFTQFKTMGDLMQRWIAERSGYKPQFLHGGVPAKERAKMVDNFQQKRDEMAMILSLKAAGTGLNLTAASSVIHYDLWWNPAVENQATDRAYRIGQKNNVQVYRLICANTFEEKINEIINSKKELADLTVNVGEKWIGELSNRQIEEIFSLGQE